MRVLAVTNMYPTPTEPWLGCFVREQVEALRGIGVSVEVLSFDGRKDWRRYIGAGRQLRRLVEEEGPFDLIHAHYGLTGAVAVAARRLPVVTTFHGSDTVIPWQRAVSWAVARLTTPVFVTPEAARRLGCPRATVIPSAVDLDLFQPIDRRAARRALGWNEDGRYVLLPGSRANPVKGASLFEAAVETARRKEPDLAAVSLEGFGRHQVPLVMSAVDVTVMTSVREGSPVAVKESLACLTPVVSVAVGDVPELLAGLPGCAVVPREPALLADALLRALGAPRHPSLRERVEPYSHRRIAEQVAKVYQEVVRRRRKQP